jgi:hypothetical protein
MQTNTLRKASPACTINYNCMSQYRCEVVVGAVQEGYMCSPISSSGGGLVAAIAPGRPGRAPPLGSHVRRSIGMYVRPGRRGRRPGDGRGHPRCLFVAGGRGGAAGAQRMWRRTLYTLGKKHSFFFFNFFFVSCVGVFYAFPAGLDRDQDRKRNDMEIRFDGKTVAVDTESQPPPRILHIETA